MLDNNVKINLYSKYFTLARENKKNLILKEQNAPSRQFNPTTVINVHLSSDISILTLFWRESESERQTGRDWERKRHRQRGKHGEKERQ